MRIIAEHRKEYATPTKLAKDIEALLGNAGAAWMIYRGPDSVFKMSSGVKLNPTPTAPLVPGLP